MLTVNSSLESIALITKEKSRSITAENKDGAIGQGGKVESQLGKGRKGSPCIDIKLGETKTIANIQGQGIIKHIWITVNKKSSKYFYVYRNLILRMYWDGEEKPSVEVPLGDFFCNGFGERYNVNSIPIAVAPKGGMNCYFPMPFMKGAKITIENQHPEDVFGFFYQIDYIICEQMQPEIGYFHAQFRREAITKLKNDFIIVDGIKGKGHYVGTFLELCALERYWWGEGEVKFYIDDDEEYPTICGTGLEDYFGGAWGFRTKTPDNKMEYDTFSYPYIGYPFTSANDSTFGAWPESMAPMHTFYRWHLPDPINFSKGLKVSVQQIGISNTGLFERQDDYASVAYWYQTEPHNEFPKLLDTDSRKPR